jgi:hypothetical protein
MLPVAVGLILKLPNALAGRVILPTVRSSFPPISPI